MSVPRPLYVTYVYRDCALGDLFGATTVEWPEPLVDLPAVDRLAAYLSWHIYRDTVDVKVLSWSRLEAPE